MKHYALRCLTLFVCLFAFVATSNSFAGWQKQNIVRYNDDGSVKSRVEFYVNQDGQQSSFTIFKNAGLRVYMTFFGATWPEFKRYMMWDDQTAKAPGDYPDGASLPDDALKILGMMGGVDMKNATVYGSSGINLKMFISDYFFNQYGKQVDVAFELCPYAGQVVGSLPNVNIEVDNANIRKVLVSYPRPQVSVPPDGGDVTAVTANQGNVTVKCNKQQTANVSHGGSVGGVIVNGGYIKEVQAPGGCDLLVVRPRRLAIGKKKLAKLGVVGVANPTLFGGNFSGDVEVKGRICKIYSANGLGGSGVDISCGRESNVSYHNRNINKIVLPRGSDGGKIAAGSKPATSGSFDFFGAIGKVVVGVKKLGKVQYAGDAPVLDTYFISKQMIRVKGAGARKGTAFSATSKNIVPFGTLDLTAANFGN